MAKYYGDIAKSAKGERRRERATTTTTTEGGAREREREREGADAADRARGAKGDDDG